MPRQAKYIIDDANFKFHQVATSWDYDNRVTSDQDDVFPDGLYSKKDTIGMRVKRDFQIQTTGKASLEFVFTVELSADGYYVNMCSKDNTVVFSISAKDGKILFNGNDTGVESHTGKVFGKVDFDIDKKTARLILDGKTVCRCDLPDFKDIAKVIMGTDGTTDINLKPFTMKLYMDYIANEKFFYTRSVLSDEWQTEGSVFMRSHLANPQMDYNYGVIDGKGKAVYPFEKTSGDINVEAYVLFRTETDGAILSLGKDGENVFGVKTENSAFYTLSGDMLRKFSRDVWQLVRFEKRGAKMIVRIDGKICGEFDVGEDVSFDSYLFGHEADGSEMAFADLVVEPYIDYPDYCPEPKAALSDKYEVGMNVCNMWREGCHYGWDRITYFDDHTPLIGAYDEGLPEVADWEIKFMVENGVSFQHFCWYCPDGKINFPIKHSRMDDALRDGYMNARYSDKMKFIIMWENDGYSNTNPEDFKDYVWKYWCEYFFTDPRYLTFENKPLISLWSFKFVEHWGGPEKAQEMIKFMNEDIKRFGFDGVLLMTTSTTDERSAYEKLSEYSDVTYAYGYSREGCRPEVQEKAIDVRNSYGLAPFIRTASVGFDVYTWGRTEDRTPLITPEDFERVLKYAKMRGDECDGDKWYNRTFIMSTWNEYGEGTYIMPSHRYGFGYLDKIREVFVPEAGDRENALPTESQKKRLSYLRIPERVIIRRLGNEKTEEHKNANTVVSGYDFSNKSDAEKWGDFNECARCEKTGSSIVINPTFSSAAHYSLISKEPSCVIRASDATHIRIKVRSTKGDSFMRVAFLTDTDNAWRGNKCEKTVKIPQGDDYIYVSYYISMLPTWVGDITDIRIDNMAELPLEVASVEFMKFTDEERAYPAIFVNGEKLRLSFDPIYEEMGYNFIVSMDPGKGFFRALKLYQEYDRPSQTLYVASASHEAYFKINSYYATVDGKKVGMPVMCSMRDGLPTMALNTLCDLFEITYRIDRNYMYIEV